MKWAVLILFTLLCAAPATLAGSRTQTKADASLEVQFDGNNPELSLADVITVTLTVHGRPGLEVIAPLDLPTSAPWLRVERDEPTRQTVNGRVRWQIVYRFAPREPGKLDFAFPDVKSQNVGAAEQTVSWQPITFSVSTSADELRDITSIEEVPPLVAEDRAWLLWTAPAALGLVAIIGAVLMLRQRRHVAKQTPAERALREWDRLIALRLPEAGRSERFVTLLTTLLRRCLERQFDIPARRQTTAEFCQHLTTIEKLAPHEKEFLTNFLEHCEAVKFAGVAMPIEECAHLARAARAFLERVGKPA
ncbi:MAG TPA: hypothetical protein VFE62_06730 [Gemmataceae bacterium]|nr:hypothetical protein [Gemmataceae bacterium]